MIRVAVAGGRGRLGSAIVAALEAANGIHVAHVVQRGDSLDRALTGSDVLVDATTPSTAVPHAMAALLRRVPVVLGASGLSDAGQAQLRAASEEQQTGSLWVPNFSLGAVLMQQCAAAIARHIDDVTLIESHHPAKLDAPSGTALDTARRIAEAQGRDADIPIHSVRLPGLIAEQTVRFGAVGQTLSVTHVTYDRAAFGPGAVLACRRVGGLEGFHVGLDAILDHPRA